MKIDTEGIVKLTSTQLADFYMDNKLENIISVDGILGLINSSMDEYIEVLQTLFKIQQHLRLAYASLSERLDRTKNDLEQVHAEYLAKYSSDGPDNPKHSVMKKPSVAWAKAQATSEPTVVALKNDETTITHRKMCVYALQELVANVIDTVRECRENRITPSSGEAFEPEQIRALRTTFRLVTDPND